MLLAFRWGDSTVSARVAASIFIDVNSQGFALFLTGPDAEVATARAAAAQVLATIEPAEFQPNGMWFQHIEPIPEPYSVARELTGETFFSRIFPQAHAEDWSMLLDGSSVLSETKFQVEFGIIDDREASGRVFRRAGQQIGPTPEGVSPAMYHRDDYPKCAFFADWRWMPETTFTGSNGGEHLFTLWDQMVEESEANTLAAIAAAGLTASPERKAQA